MTNRAAEPVEVGIIGIGNVASAYLRTLDQLVVRGLARAGLACARKRDRWSALRERRPGLQLVADPREVLESSASLIVILTPPDSHADLARAAIRAGKHVLVEKPLARSEPEGRAVLDEAGAAGVWILSAPFVHLSPTHEALLALVANDEIGRVHSARALYGNLGSDWAAWYHTGTIGPLAEVGIYNLQSLTGLLGPVAAVQAAGAIGISEREIERRTISSNRPDTVQVILHHVGGALSTVLASHAIAHYRRPALELYGDAGTACLLGDDWDPKGIEFYRSGDGHWQLHEPLDPTWHWTDGLREAVAALREDREPRADPAQDLHLLEIIDATETALASGATTEVASRFTTRSASAPVHSRAHLHDHTRAPDEQ